MSALTSCLLGWAAAVPVLAPLPPAPPPNPLAKPAIGIQADTTTCVISEVFPEMPAGKAGVRPGDRIVRIGSFHPADFTQVIGHITSYRPGAVVELEVERNGEKKTFKLTLATRPPNYGNRSPGSTIPFPPDD